MVVHFEELWEKCEKLHNKEDSVTSVISELEMKLNLYKLLSGNVNVPDHELKMIKSRAMGEILLTLTNLSQKDNVDVFESLSLAWKQRAIKK